MAVKDIYGKWVRPAVSSFSEMHPAGQFGTGAAAGGLLSLLLSDPHNATRNSILAAMLGGTAGVLLPHFFYKKRDAKTSPAMQTAGIGMGGVGGALAAPLATRALGGKYLLKTPKGKFKTMKKYYPAVLAGFLGGMGLTGAAGYGGYDMGNLVKYPFKTIPEAYTKALTKAPTVTGMATGGALGLGALAGHKLYTGNKFKRGTIPAVLLGSLLAGGVGGNMLAPDDKFSLLD